MDFLDTLPLNFENDKLNIKSYLTGKESRDDIINLVSVLPNVFFDLDEIYRKDVDVVTEFLRPVKAMNKTGLMIAKRTRALHDLMCYYEENNSAFTNTYKDKLFQLLERNISLVSFLGLYHMNENYTHENDLDSIVDSRKFLDVFKFVEKHYSREAFISCFNSLFKGVGIGSNLPNDSKNMDYEHANWTGCVTIDDILLMGDKVKLGSLLNILNEKDSDTFFKFIGYESGENFSNYNYFIGEHINYLSDSEAEKFLKNMDNYYFLEPEKAMRVLKSLYKKNLSFINPLIFNMRMNRLGNCFFKYGREKILHLKAQNNNVIVDTVKGLPDKDRYKFIVNYCYVENNLTKEECGLLMDVANVRDVVDFFSFINKNKDAMSVNEKLPNVVFNLFYKNYSSDEHVEDAYIKILFNFYKERAEFLKKDDRPFEKISIDPFFSLRSEVLLSPNFGKSFMKMIKKYGSYFSLINIFRQSEDNRKMDLLKNKDISFNYIVNTCMVKEELRHGVFNYLDGVIDEQFFFKLMDWIDSPNINLMYMPLDKLSDELVKKMISKGYFLNLYEGVAKNKVSSDSEIAMKLSGVIEMVKSANRIDSFSVYLKADDLVDKNVILSLSGDNGGFLADWFGICDCIELISDDVKYDEDVFVFILNEFKKLCNYHKVDGGLCDGSKKRGLSVKTRLNFDLLQDSLESIAFIKSLPEYQDAELFWILMKDFISKAAKKPNLNNILNNFIKDNKLDIGFVACMSAVASDGEIIQPLARDIFAKMVNDLNIQGQSDELGQLMRLGLLNAVSLKNLISSGIIDQNDILIMVDKVDGFLEIIPSSIALKKYGEDSQSYLKIRMINLLIELKYDVMLNDDKCIKLIEDYKINAGSFLDFMDKNLSKNKLSYLASFGMDYKCSVESIPFWMKNSLIVLGALQEYAKKEDRDLGIFNKEIKKFASYKINQLINYNHTNDLNVLIEIDEAKWQVKALSDGLVKNKKQIKRI